MVQPYNLFFTIACLLIQMFTVLVLIVKGTRSYIRVCDYHSDVVCMLIGAVFFGNSALLLVNQVQTLIQIITSGTINLEVGFITQGYAVTFLLLFFLLEWYAKDANKELRKKVDAVMSKDKAKRKYKYIGLIIVTIVVNMLIIGLAGVIANLLQGWLT